MKKYDAGVDKTNLLSERYNPLVPAVVELGERFLLLGLAQRRVLDCVDGELLELSQVEVPGDRCVGEVERYAGRAPEAWVVRVDSHRDSSLNERPGWVPSEVVAVAENQVADRTHFNANSLFFDFLDQVRVVDQVERVAEPLCVEQQRVVQVVVLARRRLAGVQVDLEAGVFLLRVLNHLSERSERWSRIFFVNKVEA